MKAQFDIKAGRMWPNLEPSERAQNTREYQTFVEDRLGLGGAVLHIHIHTHIFHFTIFVSFKTETDIESQENIAVLKRAMSKKHAGWSSKDLNSKSNWQRSAVEDAGQSSQDKWKSSKSRAKWKDISHTEEELGVLVKEKKSNLINSCKESSKRETEIYSKSDGMAGKTPNLMTVTDPDSGEL